MEATDALSAERLRQVKEATAADPVLQAARERIENGWPKKRRSVDTNLYCYCYPCDTSAYRMAP